MSKSVLIYEGGKGGHRAEYVCHIISYLITIPEQLNAYIFLLNTDLAKTVKTKFEPFQILPTIVSMPNIVGKNYLEILSQEWSFMKSVLDDHRSINKLIFLNFDLYQYLVIRKDFRKYRLEVQGILFQPFYHLRASPTAHLFSKLNMQLRKLRKIIINLSLFVINKNVTRIYILNDIEGVKFINRCFVWISKVDKFFYLPDPINTTMVSDSEVRNIKAKYNICNDRKIFLLFGLMDEKKNITNILLSLGYLTEGEQAQMKLIIAGKFLYQEYQNAIKLRSELMISYPNLEIILKNEVASEIEMESLFRIADAILMPYINFYSSSGVLGHAAKYNKPVIASCFGLIKQLVQQYKLGLTVDPFSPKDISNAIRYCLLNRYKMSDNSNYLKFVTERSITNFSKVLLR